MSTMARQNEGIDSATVAAIESERGPRQMRVNDSISLPVVSRFVKAVEGGGGTRESIKKYSVVVAGFSQLFNARSMRERLVQGSGPVLLSSSPAKNILWLRSRPTIPQRQAVHWIPLRLMARYI